RQDILCAMADFKDIVRLLGKLPEKERRKLALLSQYLEDKTSLKYAERLLKQKKMCIEVTQPEFSWLANKKMVLIRLEALSKDVERQVRQLNDAISRKTEGLLFRLFSKSAADILPSMIAPEIVGFDTIKKAVAIQLFSEERIHILLLGDPGTGKTKILSSATALHPISSMGLGSGTSGAGLAVTVKGNEVQPGLLPMANGGLCAIDELNLMKDESRASLYNAMESGFVAYDKGGKHYKFDARISVLATANPKGDRFDGETPEKLSKQLPFDPALLSRFHLTFLVRRPDTEQFKHISRRIISGKKQHISEEDIIFVRQYIRYANQLKEPELPKRFEQEIVDFVGDIKQNEKNYLIEVSPRLVVGFTRMSKALARAELRALVEEKDISTVKKIVKESLKIR
ncbi:MAG: ATP-binding protein, partial [Nanoarchaeota archaeon]|nr:ATP-binding protein [Nanoarchaeota archaeon]